MNIEKMRAILNKIKEYDNIVIFRHKRPDGDSVGSTKGLREILRLTYPSKNIYLINSDQSDYLSFLGDEDEPIADDLYGNALGIIIDTATTDRISNPLYSLCKEIVKIDHHIEKEAYGSVSWVEEEKSSACEMIAEFYYAFKDELKISREAAMYIFTGMVTDSGRFRFRSVSGDTMRYAGMLIDMGIDLDTIYANLYMGDFKELKFKGYILNRIKLTENGVAYLYIDKATREKHGLSLEQASACVSYMDSIRDSLIWIAFIECDDGSIRVRLRSRFVTVSEIAEKYSGGGHACAAGATVYSKKEMKKLLSNCDERLKCFKSENEGWL
jgi:phosphoesterase RecJ-like protein